MVEYQRLMATHPEVLHPRRIRRLARLARKAAEMTATIQQVADQLDLSPQYAANVVAEVENRARWERMSDEIDEALAVAEEDGD
jgi:predicted transcriptional regulator of viral defense system